MLAESRSRPTSTRIRQGCLPRERGQMPSFPPPRSRLVTKPLLLLQTQSRHPNPRSTHPASNRSGGHTPRKHTAQSHATKERYTAILVRARPGPQGLKETPFVEDAVECFLSTWRGGQRVETRIGVLEGLAAAGLLLDAAAGKVCDLDYSHLTTP